MVMIKSITIMANSNYDSSNDKYNDPPSSIKKITVKCKAKYKDDNRNNDNNHNSNIDNHNDINTVHENGPSKIKSKSTKRNDKIKGSSTSSKTHKRDNHGDSRQKDTVFIICDSMVKTVFCLQGTLAINALLKCFLSVVLK